MANSETDRHRAKVIHYCQGNGLDLGSAGSPITAAAIQVELANPYCPFFDNQFPPQLTGNAANLYWFRDEVMDYVYSSHLLEDFLDWQPVLAEWARVIKRGGYLVILIPDKTEWQKALARGQPPNLAHRHEGYPGELTEAVQRLGTWEVLRDSLSGETDDYSIIFVARKG